MDLNTMYQNGMGNFASMNAGRQVGLDQARSLADLQAVQMQNDQSAIMNPLNAQFKQGQIAEQQAQLPGFVGQAQTLASQGQVDQSTTSAKIAQRLSSYTNQIGSDGVQKMGREGAIASQVAAVLQNYPPALHKEVAAKAWASFGGDPNSTVLASIEHMPDGQVAQDLGTLGKGMVMASGEYLQKAALEKTKLDSEEKIAAGHDTTSTTNARIMADSRVQAASARMTTMMQHMNMDQKISYLSDLVAQGTATDGERQELADLKKQQLMKPAVGANGVAPAVMGLPTPMQNAEAAAGPAAPAPGASRTVVRTGTANGRKVVQYSDGSVEYAN